MAGNTGGAERTQGFAVISPPGKIPVVNSIFDFSADALAEVRLWLEQNPPAIGISNVLGFSQFTAQMSVVANNETRTSSTYGDLTHAGPALTGLPDGKYVMLWGANAAGNPSVSNAQMAVSVNGGTAPNGDHTLVAITSSLGVTAVMIADTVTLAAGGNNSITAKYASSDNASTCTWNNRWLIALRYANK